MNLQHDLLAFFSDLIELNTLNKIRDKFLFDDGSHGSGYWVNEKEEYVEDQWFNNNIGECEEQKTYFRDHLTIILKIELKKTIKLINLMFQNVSPLERDDLINLYLSRLDHLQKLAIQDNFKKYPDIKQSLSDLKQKMISFSNYNQNTKENGLCLQKISVSNKKKLSVLGRKLKEHGFLDYNNLSHFKNVFLDNPIVTKVKWRKDAKLLVYFIYLLIRRNIIYNPSEKRNAILFNTFDFKADAKSLTRYYSTFNKNNADLTERYYKQLSEIVNELFGSTPKI
jgi:hypothetical protein